MGLDKKIIRNQDETRHTNDKLKQIEFHNLRLKDGDLSVKPRKTGPTLAEKIANAKTSSERETLTRIQAKLSEKEMISGLRHWSAMESIDNCPNYFLTIAMKFCHFSKLAKFDRDHQTKKLYIVVVNLLKKLMLEIDPSLKSRRFEEWPFFVGTMEHFDDKGNIVAPHMHILLKLDIDICKLREAIERLWKKAMGRIHPNDINMKPIDAHSLHERAFYIFKHCYQDHQDKLDNGVIPDKICERYRWTLDAIAHDKWAIRRDNFRDALKVKY